MRELVAEQAVKEKQSHLCYLDALLEAEVEERERNVIKRRIKEAHFPKLKTLEEFDFETASHIPSARLRKLSEGEYVVRTEPVIFIGETGTGKTHLATALAVAACQQRRRVRFATAAELVNELNEARQKNEINRVVNRWNRYELIVLDEMCYVTTPDAAAELLFQVIAGRAERAAVTLSDKIISRRIETRWQYAAHIEQGSRKRTGLGSPARSRAAMRRPSRESGGCWYP